MTWLLLRQRLGTQHPGPARQPGLGLKVRGSGHTFSPVPAALLHPRAPQVRAGQQGCCSVMPAADMLLWCP